MSNKHDANVRKSMLVNFQIGLIASLLFTYLMFEVYTTVPIAKIDDTSNIIEEEPLVWDGEFEIYQEPTQEVVAQKQSDPIPEPEEFEVVEDDAVIKKLTEEFKNVTPKTTDTPFNPDAVPEVEDPEPTHVPFSVVEDVPVFPGCEKLKTNKEKAACFSEKISRIVSRKFNTDIGNEYGLQGVQRIYTLFDVAADGTIQNVQVRAPHPKLKKEAERVIGLLPRMTPGMQRKEPVAVKYQLPIVFKVQD
ncbi:energy transducer TonB [Aquimarina sp. RZ0]|uniref:energy transducer TonB n=1 Tax=Aquimarina sp. RZ0 TaxID=2607730 RepID=UPI00165F7712|nr:energy transducer TonB [Aquimarina sp. RZ0]